MPTTPTMWILLPLLFIITAARAAEEAFITPCPVDNKTCIVEAARAALPRLAAGVPALALAPLDPLVLQEVRSEQAGLLLRLTNTTVTGLAGCRAEDVSLDAAGGRLACVMRCDVVLRGSYRLAGRLLLLPIRGEGAHVIKIRDIVIKTQTDLSTVPGEDGRPHWHIDKWKHTFNVETNTHFQFENLFNGNTFLSEPVLQFANANWREVMREVAPPIVQAILERVFASIEQLYRAVPADELLIGTLGQ